MATVTQCLDADITELADAVRQPRGKVVDPWFVEINRPSYAHSKGRVDNSEPVRTCDPYKYHTQLQDGSIGGALATAEARLFFEKRCHAA